MTTVVFVAGVGRSGSTLLETLLGSLPGWIGVGETMHLPERGLRENQRCGCGAAFFDCAFWSEVGQRAFGGWDRVDVADWIGLASRVDRNRNLPLLLRPTLSRAFAADHARLVERLGSLLLGAAEAAEADVVVESSKHPSYGLLLAADRRLDVRFVHVVRDSRGVAYSWTKKVQRPEITDRVEFMPTYPPAQIALRWLAWNAALSLVGARRSLPSFRVRYEDFVTDPKRVVQQVAAFAGRAVDDWIVEGLLERGTASSQHSVAGNPMRFGTGPIQLRRDEQWRVELRPRDRALVTGFTAPMLRSYGYRVRPSKEGA